VTYTWKRRRIKHVTLDPSKLAAQEMPDGQWPAELTLAGSTITESSAPPRRR
jgi:hypothetical protein